MERLDTRFSAGLSFEETSGETGLVPWSQGCGRQRDFDGYPELELRLYEPRAEERKLQRDVSAFFDGNKIDGNFTLPDKTVYRRIHLEKKIEIARSCRRFRTCQLVARYCAGAFTTLGMILSMV
jgi:hypothetical protein